MSFGQIGLFPNIHILFTWPHENINIHSILKKCRALEKKVPHSAPGQAGEKCPTQPLAKQPGPEMGGTYRFPAVMAFWAELQGEAAMIPFQDALKIEQGPSDAMFVE